MSFCVTECTYLTLASPVIFFRCCQTSVQYVQPLTVRPHLYMNAAAPLYNGA